MSSNIAPDLVEGDTESNSTIAESRSNGLISCYESRLNATILQRAVDRERARRPVTTKCGRLARTEARVSGEVALNGHRVVPAPRAHIIQVVARSGLVIEPA